MQLPTAAGNVAGNLKRQVAIDDDSMLVDMCESGIVWLLVAARKGFQRWLWVENGKASMLFSRPPMLRLIKLLGLGLAEGTDAGVTTVHYCAYPVFRGLGAAVTYPTRKSTGLATNVPFEPKKCPLEGTANLQPESTKSGRHEHRGQIAGPAGTKRPKFMGVPESVCCFVTPAGLTYDLAVASLGARATAPANTTSNVSYLLPSQPPPKAGRDTDVVDFELPEWVFDDVACGL